MTANERCRRDAHRARPKDVSAVPTFKVSIRPTAAAPDQRYQWFGSVVNFHKQTAPDTEHKHSAERESWGQQGTSGGSQNLAAQPIEQRRRGARVLPVQ